MSKILLLLDNKSNLRQLKEFLKGRHEVSSPEAAPAALESGYDLCILDGPALDRLEDALRAARANCDPLFCPVLLITTREQVGMATRHLWKTINDVLLAPVEKIELLARVETLLSARRLFLELKQRERLATLGKIASGVAHELRNPLGVIHNAVYYLNQVLTPDKQLTHQHVRIKEYLTLLDRETDAAVAIAANLLYYTTASQPDPRPVSAAEALRRVLERFPSPENIRLRLDLPSGLPPVRADLDHFEHILTNLLLNAYQAMPEGGQCSVISRQCSEDTEHCPPNTEHCLLITVQDTGPGISPENIGQIFEPLFSTKPHGIGLGLAVSKKLAELNGGRIEVQSEAGEGSTFTLILPAIPTAQENA